MRASRLIAVVIFPGLIATGSGSARRRRRRPARPPALRPTGRVQIPSPPRSPSCPRRTGARSSAGTPPNAFSTGSSSVRATRPTPQDRCCSSTASRRSARRPRIPGPTSPSRPWPMASRQCSTNGVRAKSRRAALRGIATVRFKIEDGKLKALDPIPQPIATRRARCRRRSRTQRR